MEQPVVARKSPYVMEMEPGTYWWCRCGRSGNQPLCDGSHQGTGLNPMEVEITEKKKVAWCGCRHTGDQPFCDGAHKKFSP